MSFVPIKTKLQTNTTQFYKLKHNMFGPRSSMKNKCQMVNDVHLLCSSPKGPKSFYLKKMMNENKATASGRLYRVLYNVGPITMLELKFFESVVSIVLNESYFCTMM